MIIMAYEYAPRSANIDTKKIWIAAVAVLVLFVLYSVANVVTSYATYSGTLEKELNITKEDLRIVSAAREECAANLNKKTNLYSECSSNLQSTQAAASRCQQDFASYKDSSEKSYNECKAELDALKVGQISASTSYKNLVKNSVKSICCTLSDVESGSFKSWRIENDKIYCSGNLTVNCATGETNYS